MEMRKDLSAPGMLACLRKSFVRVADNRIQKKTSVSMVDSLMSGVALFGFKHASLLDFDKNRRREHVAENLRYLYGVESTPSDTQMREILDPVDPRELRAGFTDLFALLQRGKALEPYFYHGLGYIVSIDGTGYFSSDEVHCKSCCQKVDSKTGKITYYHQMLSLALVHPDIKQVIPLCPEAILKQDGTKKNDCEHNAALRLLPDLRREHPHLKFIVVEDSLSSTAPHILELLRLKFDFILGAKEGNHKSLFEWVGEEELTGSVERFEVVEKGVKRSYRFISNAPLNASNPEIKVNFIEFWEESKGKPTLHFSWVTSIPVTSKNVEILMRAGRARWKIENETFNTLKNQGYEFEHNFGHGKQNLSIILANLMMLAFLIDQSQALCCKMFQAARAKFHANKAMWFGMRAFFFSFTVTSWHALYSALIKPPMFTLNSNSDTG